MTTLTRQDVQQALNQTRDQLSSNMLSKSDLQSVASQIKDGIIRDLMALHSENQAVMRSMQSRHDMLNQRMTTIERNLQIVTNEIAKISDTIGKQTESQVDNSPFMYQRL